MTQDTPTITPARPRKPRKFPFNLSYHCRALSKRLGLHAEPVGKAEAALWVSVTLSPADAIPRWFVTDSQGKTVGYAARQQELYELLKSYEESAAYREAVDALTAEEVIQAAASQVVQR